MKEDKTKATELADKDIADLARLAEELRHGGVDASMSNYKGMPQVDADAFVQLVIGRRDNLTKTEARRAAETFCTLQKNSPLIYVSLAGYDDDPRDIWDFPSAVTYVRHWAKFAKLDFAVASRIIHWQSLAFLAACGVFGDDVSVAKPPKATAQ